MPTAIVVDDLKLDQRLAGSLLEDRAEIRIVYARHGRQALERMAAEVPDVVITDMQMPEMDGLQLVEAIRRDYPAVPVVLMTAHGSEEAAAEALRKGAASYVPKQHLARDLVPTIQRVLALAGKHLEQQAVLGDLNEMALHFDLDSEPGKVQPLVGLLRAEVERMGLLDETERTRLCVALDEALSNAVHHGSGTTDANGTSVRTGLLGLGRRRQEPAVRRAQVHLSARLTRGALEFVVRDEGAGFDTSTLPDPADPASLESSAGRGLLLIQTFMDEVSHNVAGNEITMIKAVPG